MSEVWFYHLERQPLEAVLPRILAGLMQRGERVCVQTDSADGLDGLSRAVWAHEETAFVAHGLDGDETSDRHLLWMTGGTGCPFAEGIRIYVHGAMPDDVSGLERAMVFIPGSEDAALVNARGLWKRYRAEGIVVRYWKQSESGRWEDQAAAKAA
jgi:DNA polymerase III subunit chi